MGKLTAHEILQRMNDKRIVISDFDLDKLNPNSYNLRLAPVLMAYKPRHWWTPWRKPLVWGQSNPPDKTIEIPEKGYVIKPGWFYLGSTVEWTETHDSVPIIDGRSSTGRLSLHVHATAGFGDIGFTGCWTLEIYSIIPVRVFPNIRLCQISYDDAAGEIHHTYQGRYAGYKGPVCYQPCKQAGITKPEQPLPVTVVDGQARGV
jgi:dCTP deaminase